MKKYYIWSLISTLLMAPAAVSAQGFDDEFEQIDADGDGYISAQELGVAQKDTMDVQNEKTLAVLDKDSDGFVTKEEYVNFYSSISKDKDKTELESNFKALDTDDDDKLNTDELKEFRESTFDTTNHAIINALDTDKDGKISRDEFNNFIESMKIMFEAQQ